MLVTSHLLSSKFWFRALKKTIIPAAKQTLQTKPNALSSVLLLGLFTLVGISQNLFYNHFIHNVGLRVRRFIRATVCDISQNRLASKFASIRLISVAWFTLMTVRSG